jgi:hypothetical protein
VQLFPWNQISVSGQCHEAAERHDRVYRLAALFFDDQVIDFSDTGPAPIKYLCSLNFVAWDQGSMWGRLGWVCGGFHDGISLKQLSDPMLRDNLGGSEDFTDWGTLHLIFYQQHAQVPLSKYREWPG